MKCFFYFMLLLSILSCSKNEDKISALMKESLISQQWELNDTTFFICKPELVCDYQLLEFKENTFKLYQRVITVRTSELVNDTLESENSGIYNLDYPKIKLDLNNVDQYLTGEMEDDMLVLKCSRNPSKNLYFYKK